MSNENEVDIPNFEWWSSAVMDDCKNRKIWYLFIYSNK